MNNQKRVATYFVFVVIATCFWFLNALNKTYTVDMVMPVEYINLPNNKTLANQLPDKFYLTIKAHGFTILRHQVIFFFTPFEFNVNEMTGSRMMESQKNSFAFPSRQFLTELSNQFSNEMEILNMNPDTLYFIYDKMNQKKVKVNPVIKIDLNKQFQVSGEITTTPGLIVINGPKSILDTINYVNTEFRKFNDVDQPIRSEIALKGIKEVYFSQQNVELNIPVEEYTEAQLSVPVFVKNQPSDVIVKLFPEKVKVTFLVGLSRFHDMRPEDFKLFVNYSDIKEGKQRLKITSESTPPYLYNLKIVPEEIEYLIQN